MLDELRAAGARDYSIFLRRRRPLRLSRRRRPRAVPAYLAASDVNARWQAEMGDLIDPLTDPATGFHRQLDEVFHLD